MSHYSRIWLRLSSHHFAVERGAETSETSSVGGCDPSCRSGYPSCTTSGWYAPRGRCRCPTPGLSRSPPWESACCPGVGAAWLSVCDRRRQMPDVYHHRHRPRPQWSPQPLRPYPHRFAPPCPARPRYRKRCRGHGGRRGRPGRPGGGLHRCGPRWAGRRQGGDRPRRTGYGRLR